MTQKGLRDTALDTFLFQQSTACFIFVYSLLRYFSISLHFPSFFVIIYGNSSTFLMSKIPLLVSFLYILYFVIFLSLSISLHFLWLSTVIHRLSLCQKFLCLFHFCIFLTSLVFLSISLHFPSFFVIIYGNSSTFFMSKIPLLVSFLYILYFVSFSFYFPSFFVII
jgi:hypothetical protein